ncbi:hypothetical protein BT63DRAFT_286330 [Microthyrium microscopicum]|uniref:Uncharacterized protein n=1 Tax=Microthyrium microscopicum TaxID=703497 RepID=A0A6A6UCI1_9PEZI|nr:hypothetical protein BT63DRAFT_286330 [Microthyrium microscopicum]
MEQCQALNHRLEPCTSLVAAADKKFCPKHYKVCYDTYISYKRSNAELDSLRNNLPSYFNPPIITIENGNYHGLKLNDLNVIHEYLHRRHALLDKVIRARMLHSTRFFSWTLHDQSTEPDGHAKYVEYLKTDKNSTLRALQNLLARIDEVTWENEQWYAWVKEQQQLEAVLEDEELRKVKDENKLYQQHLKAVKIFLSKSHRKQEERKNEDIEEIWEMTMTTRFGSNKETWDLVEAALAEERADCIEMIKLFLWLADEDQNPKPLVVPPVNLLEHFHLSSTAASQKDEVSQRDETSRKEHTDQQEEAAQEGKKNNPRGKKAGEKSASKEPHLVASCSKSDSKGHSNLPGKDDPAKSAVPIPKDSIESRHDMQKRLESGVRSHCGYKDVPPMRPDQVEEELANVQQIKKLLFCRHLLSHGSLFRIAVKAMSIEEFLANKDLEVSELQSLCLRLVNPSFEEIRDACADFHRVNDSAPSGAENQLDSTGKDVTTKVSHGRKDSNALNVPMKSPSLSQKQAAQKAKPKSAGAKTQLTVVGFSIWNHASERSMSRKAWLQFSILTTNCDFYTAIGLCRSWDEFSELSVLCTSDYFLSPTWWLWSAHEWNLGFGNWRKLGFIVFDAEKNAHERCFDTEKDQKQKKKNKQQQGYWILQTRSYIAAYVKRDDPYTQRLIEYLRLQPSLTQLLVRDAADGKIIISPIPDQLWLSREKKGSGLSSKQDWKVSKSLGPEFFALQASKRKWKFNFHEYYEVYVLDPIPGRDLKCEGGLEAMIGRALVHAYRIRSNLDYINSDKKILETLYRDSTTGRAMDKITAGCEISLWDESLEFKGKQTAFFESAYLKELDKQRQDGNGILCLSPWFTETDAEEESILSQHKLDSQHTWPVFPIQNDAEFLQALSLSQRDSQMLQSRVAGYFESFSKSQNPTFLAAVATEGFDTAMKVLSCWKRIGTDQETYNCCIRVLHQLRDKYTDSMIIMQYMLSVVKTAKSRDLEAKVFWALANYLMEFGQQALGLVLHVWTQIKFENSIEREAKVLTSNKIRAVNSVYKFQLHRAATLLDKSNQERFEAMQARVQLWTRKIIPISGHMVYCIELLERLTIRPLMDASRIRLVCECYASMIRFFHGPCWASFSNDYRIPLEKTYKDKAADNKLRTEQRERSLKHPVQRTGYVPENAIKARELYTDPLNQIYVERKDSPAADAVVRPVVATLYATGLIRPSQKYWDRGIGDVFGCAVSLTEPGLSSDFAIDYSVEHTEPVLCDLLQSARDFAKEYPKARFTILRVWSMAYLYPVAMALDISEKVVFADYQDRTWAFELLPKGPSFVMGLLDDNVGFLAKHLVSRLGPDAGKIVNRGDVVLVMAEDDGKCLVNSVVTSISLQYSGFLEVDLDNSFINVNLDFLIDMDPKYLGVN